MAYQFYASAKRNEPNDYKSINLIFIGTDTADLNKFPSNLCFTFFDRVNFHVQNEKKQTPVTVTKLNTVHTGVFIYQPYSRDRITSTEKWTTKCNDDNDYPIDENS